MFQNQYEPSPYHQQHAQSQPYGSTPQANPTPLQFYSGEYPGARPSLDGHVTAGGVAGSYGVGGVGGAITSQGGWLSAFGTGGFEGEPPLLEGMFLVLMYTKCIYFIDRYLVHRARHQLFTYSRKINDSSQPSTAD